MELGMVSLFIDGTLLFENRHFELDDIRIWC